MRNAFWLCLVLLIITCLACPPKPPQSPVLSPVDGALISPDSLNALTFTWPDLKDSLGNTPQRFQLFRLDSAYTSTGRRSYDFSQVMDVEIQEENSFSFQGKDITEITDGRQYFWQLTGKRTEDKCGNLFALHSFTVDALVNNSGPRDVARPNLQIAPPRAIERCDTFYLAPDCSRMAKVHCDTSGGLIAHIVNLADEAFLSNTLTMRSLDVGSSDCVRADTQSGVFRYYFQFFIEVPCNKKGLLQPEDINLYLFSDKDLNTQKRINYTTIINGKRSTSQTASTKIRPTDYVLSCASYCTSRCRAEVTINGDVMIDFQSNGDPYEHMFVFELGSGSNHILGHSGLNASHNSTTVTTNCGMAPTNPSYTYFKCVDDLGPADHQADHIVFVKVPFCGM